MIITGYFRSLLMAALLLPSLSFAIDLKPDGISIAYGDYLHSKSKLDTYQASIRWNWNKNWLKTSDNWRLTGYSDLAVNLWRSRLRTDDNPSPEGADEVYALSFSPIFRLEHYTSDWMRLFVDAGVGLSYQSKKSIEKMKKSPINMGRRTQFEIRTMIGSRFGGQMQYELSAGWFHYSNAHIHPQNEGLDFGVVQLGYWW